MSHLLGQDAELSQETEEGGDGQGQKRHPASLLSVTDVDSLKLGVFEGQGDSVWLARHTSAKRQYKYLYVHNYVRSIDLKYFYDIV